MEHLIALDSADTVSVGARLKEIVAPTAIVWGRHDPFLGLDIGQRLKDAIPGSTLEVIPTASHFSPEDAPAKVGDAIRELLKRA
jgi:pimeloyl-ACP methyl ester carboxylesterase